MRVPLSKMILPACILGVTTLLFSLSHHIIRTYRGLSPGDELPDLPLESFDGDRVDSGSWRGSPILLVLFLPGCPSCRAQINDLESVACELPDLNVALLSVNGLPLTMNTSFPVYRDPSGRFLEHTRKLVVPTLYWMDSEGKVKYARAGRREFSADLSLFRTLLTRDESHE
jgi:thiol-disulfide isomerase/thioredoxin